MNFCAHGRHWELLKKHSDRRSAPQRNNSIPMKRNSIPKRFPSKKENWFNRGPQFDHVDDFILKLHEWLAWGLWRLFRLTLVMWGLAFVLTVISNQVTPKKAKPPAIQTNTIQSR